MLASENATQRGSTAAAAMHAVQAICRELDYDLLRWDEATFMRIHAKVGQNPQITYRHCRGVSKPIPASVWCVKAFAAEGTFSEHQVRLHLGVLKDSGRMVWIIAATRVRAETELRAMGRGLWPR